MATVRVTYCGMEGEGKTLTAAKQDAARKAEEALTGDYTPVLVQRRGIAALVYREPAGWRTQVIVDEQRAVRGGAVWGGYEDKEDATQSALYHVVQLAWDGEEGDALDDLAKGLDRRRLDDLRGWVRFQLLYRRAVECGLADHLRHGWACWHGGVDRFDAARRDGPKPGDWCGPGVQVPAITEEPPVA